MKRFIRSVDVDNCSVKVNTKKSYEDENLHNF